MSIVISRTGSQAWLLPLPMPQVRALLDAMLEELARQGRALPGVVLYLVDDGCMARANACYMGCCGPTNVLSFPGDGQPGQLLLALPTLERECLLYGQDRTEHLLRLLAHGMGHLAGLDHGPEMDSLCAACAVAASAFLERTALD